MEVALLDPLIFSPHIAVSSGGHKRSLLIRFSSKTKGSRDPLMLSGRRGPWFSKSVSAIHGSDVTAQDTDRFSIIHFVSAFSCFSIEVSPNSDETSFLSSVASKHINDRRNVDEVEGPRQWFLKRSRRFRGFRELREYGLRGTIPM